MSSTIVFAAFEDGDMIEVGAARNAFGGAMHVWRALGAKHLGNEAVAFTDPAKLWALADDKRLAEQERIVHVSTFDRAYVRRENIMLVADAIDGFTPSSDNLKQQASHMRAAYHNGARVVGWQQTTVSGNLWSVDTDDGEDSRPLNIDSDAISGPEVKPAPVAK
jgi:hypothetical protein